jgi:predicted ferric reductase
MYDTILVHFELGSKWPFANALNDSQDTYRVYFMIIPFFVSFLLFALKGAMRPKYDLVLERPRLLNFLRHRLAFGLSVTDVLLIVVTLVYSILLVWARMKRSMLRGAKKLVFVFQDSGEPIERFTWEWVEILAKTLGVLAIVLLGWFVLMPMGRKSILLEVLQVPREIAVKYHRWLGWFTLDVALLHIFLFLSVWIYANGDALYDPDGNMLRHMMVPRSCKDGSCDADTTVYHIQNMYGYGTAICMIFMSVTSLNYVRRKYYDIFFYSHQVYWLLTLFLCFHYPDTLTYLIPGIAILLVDKTIGFVSMFFAVKAEATILSPDWFEIKVRKGKNFRCEAGQYVFLNVPAVSVLEWHPMTVTWETKDELALHIKAQGNDSWSQRVIEEVQASAGYLPVRLDGFYGSNQITTGVLAHKDAVVFFCGGIGLTFPMSIIIELCTLRPKMPVHLNWVTRTKEEYVAFEKLLVATQERFSNLSVSVWITLSDAKSLTDEDDEEQSSERPRYGRASVPKAPAEEEAKSGDDDDNDTDDATDTSVWLGHRSWIWSVSTHALVNAVALILATAGFALARKNEGTNESLEPRYFLGSRFVELFYTMLMVLVFVFLAIGIRLGTSIWKSRSAANKNNSNRKKSRTIAPPVLELLKSNSEKYKFTDSDWQIDTSSIIRGVGKRPDIAEIMEKIHDDCQGSAAKNGVAVNACGPEAMVDMVKGECQKRVSDNWTMYEEEWEW